jgi:hypothetical protein
MLQNFCLIFPLFSHAFSFARFSFAQVLMAVENIAEDAPMSPKIQSPPSSPSSPSREEPSVEVIEQVAQQPSVDLSKLPPQIVGAIKELYERDYASWGALFPETDYICDPELQARIANFHKMKLSGRSLNRELRKSKAFRNPDILDKLVKRSGLKELGSNYPSHLFDPYAIPETDYYDSIGLYMAISGPINANSDV